MFSTDTNSAVKTSITRNPLTAEEERAIDGYMAGGDLPFPSMPVIVALLVSFRRENSVPASGMPLDQLALQCNL
jgi:hypothetical protein